MIFMCLGYCVSSCLYLSLLYAESSKCNIIHGSSVGSGIICLLTEYIFSQGNMSLLLCPNIFLGSEIRKRRIYCSSVWGWCSVSLLIQPPTGTRRGCCCYNGGQRFTCIWLQSCKIFLTYSKRKPSVLTSFYDDMFPLFLYGKRLYLRWTGMEKERNWF